MKNKQEIYKITSIILILDQFIKLIINNNLEIHQKITVIPNFFSIYYLKNTGAAFSILENNTTFLIIVSVILIILINNIIKKETDFNKLSRISLGLILGGIFGNLIDRIIHHGVIDYLSFVIFNYGLPVFNLADICITGGTFLLLISFLLDYKEKRKKR